MYEIYRIYMYIGLYIYVYMYVREIIHMYVCVYVGVSVENIKNCFPSSLMRTYLI